MKTSSRSTHLSSLRRWANKSLVFASVAWWSSSVLGALPSMFDCPARMNTFTGLSSARRGVITNKLAVMRHTRRRIISDLSRQELSGRPFKGIAKSTWIWHLPSRNRPIPGTGRNRTTCCGLARPG